MDTDFSEEQEMLKKSAREFLDKECPKQLVRAMEKDEKGYSPELWKKMAELGWLGLAFPKEFGGTGFKFLEMAVLLEEMGRALVPGPFLSTMLCGLSILSAGTANQKQEVLPKIAEGNMILTLALTEPDTRYEAEAIKVKAIPKGDNFVINGTKLFVPDAHVADYMLCAARTKDDGKPEEGITLFIVDAKSPGIKCSSLVDTIARDKQFELVFDNVEVPKGSILGELNKGWAVVRQIMAWGAVAECARMLGGGERILEMSTSYAMDRIQYEQPIGKNQVIQHYLADMRIDLEGCRYITYLAAWSLSEGLPSTTEVYMAKTWVNDAYYRILEKGHHIHGYIGFTEEMDVGLYFRRGRAQGLNFGDSDFSREMVARELGI